VTFRLVVPRPEAARRGATVDTLDCVAWKPALQRRMLRWQGGETVAVSGSLRRRFWRGPAGASSRTEVEVDSARVQ
jgi:single-strand DNA-binding protein